MKPTCFALLLAFVLGGCMTEKEAAQPELPPPPPLQLEDGWVALFDGTSLDGWRASENTGSFTRRDGSIVAHGPRSHLFYAGPIAGHAFKSFEFKADVLTRPGANAGIYFHTAYQDEGWPEKGYEVQVNNSYRGDPRRTGSLYAVSDIHEAPAADDTWFTLHIIVQDPIITIRVDGETLVTYTEPDDLDRPNNMRGRVLDRGTFALQAHDPDSEVHFRNLRVKPLPD